MTKCHQLANKPRKKRKRRCKVPALFGCPQKRGVIYKVATMSPRKPNSAKRKIVKVRILGNFLGKRAFANIPGIGPNGLNEFNIVLLEGGNPKDSPGINYSLIRGKLDFFEPELYGRQNRRSKFGAIKHEYVIAEKKREEDKTEAEKERENMLRIRKRNLSRLVKFR
jgi:small subunit ribosomal protein S12